MLKAMMTAFCKSVKKGIHEDAQKIRLSLGYQNIGALFREWWKAIFASLIGVLIAQTLLPIHPLWFVAVTVGATALILAFLTGVLRV